MAGAQQGADTAPSELPCVATVESRSPAAFAPDSSLVALGSVDSAVQLWTRSDRKVAAVKKGGNSRVVSLAFSPCGRWLATGDRGKQVRLWDMANQQCVAVLQMEHAPITAVCFSHDGTQLITGSNSSEVCVWSTHTHEKLNTLPARVDSADSLAMAPCSHLLAVCSLESTPAVELWTTAPACARVALLFGHKGHVLAVAFAPCGRLLATGSQDGTAKLWDLHTNTDVRTLTGHARPIVALAFAPNSLYLATGSQDTTARLWNVGTGECKAVLMGHANTVAAVAFGANSALVATGSLDCTARVWDTAGCCIASLPGLNQPVVSVAISPDGGLVTALQVNDQDSKVRIYDW